MTGVVAPSPDDSLVSLFDETTAVDSGPSCAHFEGKARLMRGRLTPDDSGVRGHALDDG
jgi:hypothetical protein